MQSQNLAKPQGDKLVVKSFNHGQSNPTYLLEVHSSAKEIKRYVCRRQPQGKIVSPTAHRVDREFQVMQALHSTSVSVPKVLALCMDSAVLGSNFYIMEFCEGRCFKDASLPELKSASDKRAVWFSAVDTLAKLHDVDIFEAKLDTFGPKSNDYFVRQVRTLTKVSLAQEKVDLEKVRKLDNLESNGKRITQWINAAVDEPRPCIVHGDFKMDNLLVHPTKPEIAAVIDWEMSTVGTFGADLANLLLPFYIPKGHPLATFLSFEEGEKGEIPTLDELLARYASKRQNPKMDFATLKQRMYLYVAFQMFKNSVILQGIASRVASGQASNESAAYVGSLAYPIDSLTKDILDQFEQTLKSKM